MEQQFAGEHLFPGYLGQLLIIIGFVSALLSAFSYFSNVQEERAGISGNTSWLRLGRVSYWVHTLSIAGAFATLFYIIANHLFEYHYAYSHSSRGLQVKYLFSCFWEGSEGSFLLWAFWQAVLGIFVMLRKDVLESRTMTLIAIVQALLCTMLLGIYLGPDIKIGSTPFLLLRDSGMLDNAPMLHVDADITKPLIADYMSRITDGRGLNVLLQNYWMVIHPPVLFLGFAMIMVPFAYSLAALWKRDYKSFVAPALRWSLIGGGILGLGIMMGGAWAYESLNFGGYWAWDPVENASLVPWLVWVGGLHTLIIYKSTQRSLKITVIFFTLAFLLVWYSTFLTRTGILGDTSVHAFTGAANFLYWHLLIVIGFFILISLVALIGSWSKMPKVAGEEEASSREFWMLIGSVFLLISSLIIIGATSLPVWAPLYKTITGIDIAPPNDVVSMYNNINVWFGIIIALLSGAIQFLKYKKTGGIRVWKQLGVIGAISLVLAILLAMGQKIKPIPLILFGFTVLFTIIANVVYIWSHQHGKLKKAGASITHFGFGLMLLGILLSGYGKRIISLNMNGQVTDYGKETFEENAKESRENVLIFRNTYVPMDEYQVTYLGDSVVNNDPPLTYYKIKFDRHDPETNELEESFVLKPDVFVNPKGQDGISPNPDARHYLTHDIFTYIASISRPEDGKDTAAFRSHAIRIGDTIFVANGYLVFDSLTKSVAGRHYEHKDGDVGVTAILNGYTIDGKVGSVSVPYIIRGNETLSLTDTLRELGVEANLGRINPETEVFEFNIRQRSQQDDFVVIKAMIFPYIGVLWAGIIMMFAGFMMSWLSRRAAR